MPWLFIFPVLGVLKAQNFVYEVPYIYPENPNAQNNQDNIVTVPAISSKEPDTTGGLPFIIQSSSLKPISRNAPKSTLDAINKGYGSVLNVFKRNAAFKRENNQKTTKNSQKNSKATAKRSGTSDENFLKRDETAYSLMPTMKRGFLFRNSKNNWFSKASDPVVFVQAPQGKIPLKRWGMAQNEKMIKHKRDAYTRPDYMPLFKRAAFEIGDGHGGETWDDAFKRSPFGQNEESHGFDMNGEEQVFKREDPSEGYLFFQRRDNREVPIFSKMYKRMEGKVPIFSNMYKRVIGRPKNFVQLASQFSQKQKRGRWMQDPRAGLLLMKGPAVLADETSFV